MDIDALVKFEAPDDSAHDKIYAAALRASFDMYKDMSVNRLIAEQGNARERYRMQGNMHRTTAD